MSGHKHSVRLRFACKMNTPPETALSQKIKGGGAVGEEKKEGLWQLSSGPKLERQISKAVLTPTHNA